MFFVFVIDMLIMEGKIEKRKFFLDRFYSRGKGLRFSVGGVIFLFTYFVFLRYCLFFEMIEFIF